MRFLDVFFSTKTIISASILLLVSFALIEIPLVGTLGFEFSIVISFVAAFTSALIAVENARIPNPGNLRRGQRFSDIVSSVFTTNFVLLLLPFIVGLTNSIVKKDCSIKEGIVFYVLIPYVTVLYSSCLGLFCGTILKRWAFLLSSLVLIASICLSLYYLYSEPPLFVYNAVFGFFPGPLYDEVIPITESLVIYRAVVACYGILLLLILKLSRGIRYAESKALNIFAISFLCLVIVVFYTKKEELGITHTRSYITKKLLPSFFETDHFVIHYVPGTPEAKKIKLIAGDHEFRYHQLTETLKTEFPRKIHSYLYPDTKMRKRIIGAGETNVANPIRGEIHLVYETFPNPVLKHELTHVISSEFGMPILRISPRVGLIEGLAVACEEGEGEITLHKLSQSMIELGLAPQIKEILGLGFWYKPPARSYVLSGSFVRYLIDNYGVDKFKTAYRRGSFSIYEKSLEELTSDWKRFLSNIKVEKYELALAEDTFRIPSIFNKRCPRKIAPLREKGREALKEGRLYEARDFLLRALSFNKEDPSLIQALAYTSYYAREYRDVIKRLDSSPLSEDSIVEVRKNILENLRGNALWQMGKKEEAKSIFDSLTKKTIPEGIRREIEIKVQAISTEGLEEKMRDYFSTRDEAYQVAILGKVMNEFPSFSPAYYLLGRIFFLKGDYKKAMPLFLKAESLGFSSKALQVETLRLSGIALFATRNYVGAKKRFGDIANLTQDEGLRNYALDFIERCRWAQLNPINHSSASSS